MSAAKTVLLLTHSGDFYVPDIVIEALAKRGANGIRINTDLFPSASQLAVSSDADGLRALFSTASDEVDLMRVAGIWCRRLWTGDQTDVHPTFAGACAAQARDAMNGVLALLEESIPVINRPVPQRRAEHKVLQLRAAQAAKLTLPPTLITNDPAAVRAFAETHENIVTKMLVPLSQTMEGTGPFVYTSAVDAGDLAQIDSVRSAPMIFQARVKKAREVRAMVVGKKVFSASIDADSLDWRVPLGVEPLQWREEKLPRAIRASCVRLVESMGLVTGALDFLIDSDNKFLFLEINPAGEWGWLERDLGFPISDAIADELLRRRRGFA